MTTPHSIPTTQADASASLASPEVLRTKDDAAAPPVSTDALLKGPRDAARVARGAADGAPAPLQTITNDATDPRLWNGFSVAAGAQAAGIDYIEPADARSDASGACQLLLSAADVRGRSRGLSGLLVAASSVEGGDEGLQAQLFSGSFDDVASLCSPLQVGRPATRATSERGDVDMDYQSALAAYAPRVYPSRAGTGSTYPIDWEKWGVYKKNEQIEDDIARLRSITIGGKSALDVGLAVANAAGETFFRHFEAMVPQNITERAGRAAALTTVATNNLANAAMGIDRDGYERKTEEGPHVQPLREIRAELEKLGAVAGTTRVEGPLADFACAHDYKGHVGTGQKTKVSPIGCLLRKFIIIGSYLGKLSDIVEDGVDCSFGNRTMKLKKYESLASDKAGNFGSAARGGASLCEEHQNPRDTRFEIEKHLRKGALGEGAWGVIGKFGDLLKDAAARGKGKIFFFPMGGFNASACLVTNVVAYSKKPIRDMTKRAESWKATLERCKVVEPVLFYVYDALHELGMMHEPTQKRSEYACLKGAWDVITSWRRAKSPLADSFVAGFGDGAKLIILTDAFEKIQKWDAGAAYARELLRYAGVTTLSELVLVKGDSSGGVKVPGARAFAGGYHYVPKHLAVDDGHGGFAPKRQKCGTGNGPTLYKCHRCPNEWRPERFKESHGRGGYAVCTCGALVAPPA